MKDLIGQNIVVYDLEIKNAIEKLSKGWNSKDEMGISVACAFDYRSYRYRVFMDDNLQELVDRLNEPKTLVVAFNQINFDNEVLRATGYALKKDNELLNYDMMVESRKGSGCLDKYAKGFRLDDHLSTLKLPMKSADGAMAPKWWEEKKVGTVVDYCLTDVHQEKNLFEYIWEHKKLACKWRSDPYAVEDPRIKMGLENGTEQQRLFL